MPNLDFKNHYTKTPEIHTPFVDVVFPSEVEKYMILQCNNDKIVYTNAPEVKHLEQELNFQPKNVLEIGGGIGRVSVYFRNRFNWQDTNFYMLDGNYGEKQICPVDGSETKAFYNSFDATMHFMTVNGIKDEQIKLLDANTDKWMDDVDIQFDLIYSFLSIGFHWDINLYTDKLLRFCKKDTLIIFGMRGTDRGNEFAEKQIEEIKQENKYEIIKNIRESELFRSSVLILRKK